MNVGNGTESTLVTTVSFFVIASLSVTAAFMVVWLKDVFRAAIALMVSFVSIAGLLILLRAEFLAVIQILIYVGAIAVLITFAVLMTKDVEHGNPFNHLRIPAGVVAVAFLLIATFVALNTEWTLWGELSRGTVGVANSAGETIVFSEEILSRIDTMYSDAIPTIAELLLRDFVLAFEIASVLLLAALIGAITIIRE